MQRRFLLGLLGIALLGLSACGWKPQVTATPITEPWASMDLPVKENAVVWASTPTELKVVHKDSRALVYTAYNLALAKAGWMPTKKENGDIDYYYYAKGAEKLEMQLYDFHNTGVIIKKS